MALGGYTVPGSFPADPARTELPARKSKLRFLAWLGAVLAAPLIFVQNMLYFSLTEALFAQ